MVRSNGSDGPQTLWGGTEGNSTQLLFHSLIVAIIAFFSSSLNCLAIKRTKMHLWWFGFVCLFAYNSLSKCSFDLIFGKSAYCTQGIFWSVWDMNYKIWESKNMVSILVYRFGKYFYYCFLINIFSNTKKQVKIENQCNLSSDLLEFGSELTPNSILRHLEASTGSRSRSLKPGVKS